MSSFQAEQIWIGENGHRRIIAVGNGHVLYSRGGDRNRECKLASFRRWVVRAEAALKDIGGGGAAPSSEGS